MALMAGGAQIQRGVCVTHEKVSPYPNPHTLLSCATYLLHRAEEICLFDKVIK